MKNVVNKQLLVWGFLCVTFISFSQKKSEQLKSEQEKLEKQVSTTKSMLDKVKKNTQASMSELKLIDNQVRAREELVQNVDNQIRGAELTISSKSNQVKSMTERVKRLKAQYRKLVIYAYKHRNRYGKMMYVFSASNYFEAVKRNGYLKRIAELQHKQFKLIRQNQKSINEEIGSIYNEKKSKEELLQLKIKEKEQIEKDKKEKEKALVKLKKDEGKLMAELKNAEKKKAELKKRIKKAIESEIAAAEAKEKKKTTASSSSGSKGKTSGSSGSSEKTADKKPVVVTETKESMSMGKNFEANRGKLPWPVLKGTITEAYGKNPHPTLANVYTNNNGIDIGAPKNSQVRAVFEGEVTSVFNISGAGKVVIVKHGNYRTVYSNLQEVFVAVGSKVSTKQAIGSLLIDDDGGLSTCHFEIHQVVDGMVQRINPSLWLAQ